MIRPLAVGLLLAAALAPAGWATVPGGASLRIENESAPPGGVALVQIELTEPKPIPVGELSFRFDRRFVGRIFGAGAFSDTFDLIGVGILRDQDFLFRFLSLDGRLGLAPDIPILVIALEVDASAQPGTQSLLTAQPAGQGLLNPQGQPYPTEVKTGNFTIGGVSIDRVVPGNGTIAAGTTIRFEGHGFQPGAKIDIDAALLGPLTWISALEMRAVARESFPIDGRRIRLRNPDGSEDTFYTYTPLPANPSEVEVLTRSVPFFGKDTFDSARIRYPSGPAGAEAFAVQNEGQGAVEVSLAAFSREGVSLGVATVSLPGETVQSYSVRELIAGAPPGAVGTLMVRAPRPIKVLGLLAEQATDKVTPLKAETAVAPEIYAGGVVDAGGYSSTVAPGTIVAIFGTGFAGGERGALSIPLPVTLGGAAVTFDGIPAPLFFVSEGQINALAPFEIAGPDVAVRVTVNGQESNAVRVARAAVSPGVLSQDASGSGSAVVVDAVTGLLATPAAPLARGAFATIFLVGLGAVSNQPPTGTAAPGSPLAETLAMPQVRLGEIAAEVTFAGMTPGAVGLYQINIRVPANAPVGAAVPLRVSIEGAVANTVTVPIQ